MAAQRADGEGARSVDFLALREYTYSYREGTLVRAKEYSITVENGVITGRTVVTTVSYTYNADGALTKKQFTTADGTDWVINYEPAAQGTVLCAIAHPSKKLENFL